MAFFTRSIKRPSRCLATATRARKFHSTTFSAEQYPRADLQTFNKVVGTKGRLVLVDFYADWCGPCHTLSPILEQLTTNTETETRSGWPLDLVKVNTDDEDGLSLGQKFKIRALPTVIAFRDGKPVDQFVGALNEPTVRDFLRKV